MEAPLDRGGVGEAAGDHGEGEVADRAVGGRQLWDLVTYAIDDDLGANSLTLAEVLVVPVRTGRLEAARAALRDLEVSELPFPPDAAVRLAELRAMTGLRMPDCCVLLAAGESTATVASFDERVAAAAEDRNLPVLVR